jgi:hypothetical protein
VNVESRRALFEVLANPSSRNMCPQSEQGSTSRSERIMLTSGRPSARHMLLTVSLDYFVSSYTSIVVISTYTAV